MGLDSKDPVKKLGPWVARYTINLIFILAEAVLMISAWMYIVGSIFVGAETMPDECNHSIFGAVGLWPSCCDEYSTGVQFLDATRWEWFVLKYNNDCYCYEHLTHQGLGSNSGHNYLDQFCAMEKDFMYADVDACDAFCASRITDTALLAQAISGTAAPDQPDDPPTRP
jgi:hypothetical protein